MGAIQKLAKIENEWQLARTAFQNSRAELYEITEAVRNRIENQKVERDERIKVLEEILLDDDTSATAEKMARLEIEQLKAATHAPTDEETAIFDEAEKAADAAVRDLNSLREDCKKVYKDAEGEITEIYDRIVGDPHHGLRENWISSAWEGFHRLK